MMLSRIDDNSINHKDKLPLKNYSDNIIAPLQKIKNNPTAYIQQ